MHNLTSFWFLSDTSVLQVLNSNTGIPKFCISTFLSPIPEVWLLPCPMGMWSSRPRTPPTPPSTAPRPIPASASASWASATPPTSSSPTPPSGWTPTRTPPILPCWSWSPETSSRSLKGFDSTPTPEDLSVGYSSWGTSEQITHPTEVFFVGRFADFSSYKKFSFLIKWKTFLRKEVRLFLCGKPFLYCTPNARGSCFLTEAKIFLPGRPCFSLSRFFFVKNASPLIERLWHTWSVCY